MYQEQINNLETLKTNTQEKYDAIIQKYEDWKQKFKDSVDSYDEQQARLQGLELTGIDLENTNWIQRIDNLNGFVNSYKGKLSELQTAQENYNAIQSQLNNDAINSANSVIDAIIKSNDNLTESLSTNDFEMIGKDLGELENLIKRLEELRNAEIIKEEKDNKEEEIVDENESSEQTNSVQNDISTNNINNIAF